MSVIWGIFTVFISPWGYYRSLIEPYTDFDLEDIFAILQACLTITCSLSSYVVIGINWKRVLAVLNQFQSLFLKLHPAEAALDYTLLEKFQKKLILTSLYLTIISNTIFVATSDGMEFVGLIFYYINEAHMMIMVWYFDSFAILGSMLYRRINFRVGHAVGLLRNFDSNDTYWDSHRTRKSKVCRSVLREIQLLCYLHRKTHSAVQEISELFQFPALLAICYEFTLCISTVSFPGRVSSIS